MSQGPEEVVLSQLDEENLNIEVRPLQRAAEKLAGELRQARPSARAADVRARIGAYEKQLEQYHRHFQQSALDELNLSYASEWVLDNYYILRQALYQMRKDLSAGYLRRLPKIDRFGQPGMPRVYFMARDYLETAGLDLDREALEQFTLLVEERGVQLSMGELWALPIFLRYTLIEGILYALHEIVKPEKEPVSTVAPFHIDESCDDMVANAVVSLRAVSNLDWKEFFETVNPVDQQLRRDPAGVYAEMDFATRNLYRSAVEEIAFAANKPEGEAAAAALARAQHAAANGDGRKGHIGYWLVDAGRPEVERGLGARFGARQWGRQRRGALYVAAIVLLTAALLALPIWLLSAWDATTLQWIVALALLLVPALTISTGLVNWLVTLLLPPSMLPKLDLEDGVPADLHSLVIIPCLLTDKNEITSLAQQLEQHYLRNATGGLHFALVSDFADADSETQLDDAELVAYAARLVEQLNARHRRPDGVRPFLLLHRRRLWNASEGKWMGWERKRGKLHELNQLILGEENLSFAHITGDVDALKSVRYVITLDADTVLPIGAANRLVGTLAHPLNQAVFAGESGRVTAGYTVLQPRVEISPRSANRSLFTRIYSGDVGLDLYTLAVSDVYQDLTGEGIYVGKGIYDVRAFERSIARQIPENRLLSHDLLEGLLGRAGLVTDITMIEDYPPNYFAFAQRAHRWIRGDWQLLPWLFSTTREHGRLGLIDVWKIFDNLRRSLLAPTLLALLLAGWTFLPGPAGAWTGLAVLALGIPLLTQVIQVLAGGLRSEEPLRAVARPLLLDILRWALALVFLPYEAIKALGAIGITLYRLLISRRNLLQWTTAAQSVRILKRDQPGVVALRETLPAVLLSAAVLVLLASIYPERLAPALPLLAAWIAAPLAAIAINRPARRRVERLNEDQEQKLRSYAHRTWAFYEQFVGPEDHWLPPDHYQESPLGIVAHRTSPTNIGMLLTSTLVAYDLGYIDQYALLSRLSATMETLGQMERYRGHFINWIDTRTLEALTPRYVSTVDSGNLAASLVLMSQTLQALHRSHIIRWNRWQGYLDILGQLDEAAHAVEVKKTKPVQELSRLLDDVRERVLAARYDTSKWYGLFQEVRGPVWQQITGLLSDLVAAVEGTPSAGSLQRILLVSRQMDQQIKGIERTVQELVPWVPLLEVPPRLFAEEGYAADMAHLREALPYSPAISEIRAFTGRAAEIADALEARVHASGGEGDAATEALYWLKTLREVMRQARDQEAILTASFLNLSNQAEKLVSEMDFRFLYDRSRHVFHIGYNLDAARLDDNYYDLLASEARITSLIAIAKGDVPVEHWLHLNRPVTSLSGMRVLLSWSATLFEYLMPALYLRTYPNTLLEESARGAVMRQIEYGRQKGVPWGISESGFYQFDANQNYQYRAFGVPGLGFKRGLADDLVIAPYASLMAVGFAPQQVLQNTARLAELGGLGQYGFYEALDFTEKRVPVGEKCGIVRSYMAHHQGMILLAVNNYLNHNLVLERMHADPQIQSVELLLQEQVPLAAPVQNPESEDVGGTQRLIPPLASVDPWIMPTQTSIPQVHLLSNENFSSLVTNSGSGHLRWNDTDLTRWETDPALDGHGIWVYLQDLDASAAQLWSICRQPLPVNEEPLVIYHPHMAMYRRDTNGIAATMEVSVPPDDAVEIRRVHLHNPGERARRLRLTSYGEVVLGSQAADARHPAFNKLFIQSEFVEGLNLLVFRRRPRSNKENPPLMGHMLVTAQGDALNGGFETDRMRFLGRGGGASRPASLLAGERTAGATGSTLDPVFSLGQEVEIPAHSNRVLAWVTLAADSREDLLALAARYSDWRQVERAFQQAHAYTENRLRRAELGGSQVEVYSQLLSGLLYPMPQMRAAPEIIAANRLGQSGLWPFGISGDYPILLVEVRDTQKLELVREAILAHNFFHERGVLVDLVILNEQHTNYGAEMNRLLYRLINRSGSDMWINQRGGIFVLYADQMRAPERALLKTAARVVLTDEGGGIAGQIPGYSVPVPHLPAFVPSRSVGQEEPTPALERLEDLQFHNGFGGFSADGREYVIDLPSGARTPLPWSNVVGYPDFGFLVTESGASNTWAVNSGENRLTPWSNDPVSDPTGEALYLRDEETGAVWSPTPQPAGAGGHYRVRHGAGYTQFEHNAHGLRQRLRLFAAPDAPVKIIQLRVENTWNRPRRITATQFVEWVLGTLRPNTQQYLIPEFLDEHAALLATNPYSAEFGERVAFLASSRRVHGMTSDRLEFIGRNGSMAAPAALGRIGLEGRVQPGDNPCAVLQVHIDLPPGGSEEIHFLLGQGNDREHALRLIERFRSEEHTAATWQAVSEFWERMLGAVQVNTPDAAMNVLLNRWLLYQALSCRIWGRTAFYQSSGAFGFRDQLQDVLAVLGTAPHIAREHILRAARHQFEEGDVLHWWHPPSGRGVRTRFSDDLLWLPYVVSEYVRATGDTSVLDEQEPFRTGPELAEGEDEHYGHFELTSERYTIYEHCRRALARGATRGIHGLPLMGSGDWNDGMNRVGIEGRGESVWLGWFLYDTLERFSYLCEGRGCEDDARIYRERAQELRRVLHDNAWDGRWYLRAYYDSGHPLGSHNNQECQIDSIAQSWSVISGAGDPDRARQAMRSVLEHLVREDERLILLFTPPFDKTPHDPGYIKGYVPGIRENGGQYTHAAIWVVWAFSQLGQGQQAGLLFQLMNPVLHSADQSGAQRYKVEPYVIAADVYGVEPHTGRGGWTWYTGSSGWFYRLGLEALLGLQLAGGALRFDPVIPPAWDGFEMTYRVGGRLLRISVRNPNHVACGVVSVRMDGVEQVDGSVPLADGTGEHQVEVLMG